MHRLSLVSWPAGQVAAALLLLCSLGPTSAAAAPGDWPTWRHDRERTGRSGAVGGFGAPTTAWSLEVGATQAVTTLGYAALDGSGAAQVIALVNGRVLAYDAQRGQLLWDTPWFDLSTLIGFGDPDAAGTPTVVVARGSTPASVVVLDGRSGQVAWTSPPLPSTMAGLRRETVRLADVDGDGGREILFAAPRLPTVFAYRRDAQGGFSLLWRADFAGYSNFNPFVVGDLDGDGVKEVALPLYRDLLLLRGTDGQQRLLLPGVQREHAYDHLEVADLAGDATPELLIVGRTYQHSITVVDGRAARVLWQLDYVPAAGTALLCPVRAVGDVDGDGRPEVVAAVYDDRGQELDAAGVAADHDGVDAPGVWSLLVLRGTDGVAVAHFGGWVPEALADLDGDGRVEILARAAAPGFAGPTRLAPLRVLALRDGVLRVLGEVGRAALVLVRDERPEGLHDMVAGSPALVAASAPGPAAFFAFRDGDGDGHVDALGRFVVRDGALQEEATSPLGPEVGFTGLALRAAGDGPAAAVAAEDELVLGRDDGLLEVRGRDLGVRRTLGAGGSFAPTVVVATLAGDAAPHLFHTTADGSVEARQLPAAPGGEPPPLLWRYRAGFAAPLTVDEAALDGRQRLLTLTRSPQGVMGLAALDAASGEELWSYQPAGDWTRADPPVLGELGEPGRPAVVVRGYAGAFPADSDLRLVALDRQTGALLWDVAATINVLGSPPLLVADVDGDGKDEVIHVDSGEVEVLGGAVGDSRFHGPCEWCKHQLLADLDGDGRTDFLAGQAEQLCLWSGGPLGDSAWCAAVRYRGEGSAAFPAVARRAGGAGMLVLLPAEDGMVSAWQGWDGQLAWQRRLSGGEALPPAEAGNVGATDATVAALEEDGSDDVLLGSSDGFVYALGAVDGELRWSCAPGAVPAELVVADVQGDGAPALLVGSADGHVQLLQAASLDPPQRVREVALDAQGQPDAAGEDLDVWERSDVLAAAWDAVPDAVSYRVRLLTANGVAVVPWTEAGPTPRWLFQGLQLVAGSFYQAQVIAVGRGGGSVPAASDGVTIVDLSPPEIAGFAARPDPFDPARQSTSIGATLTDLTGLATWQLQIEDAGGRVVRSFQQVVHGVEAQLLQPWAGDDAAGVPLDDGTFRLLLVVADGAGHQARAEASVGLDRTVADAGQDVEDGGEDAGGPVVADVGGAAGRDDGVRGSDDGCRCNAARTTGAAPGDGPSWPLLLVIWMVLLRVGRR